MASHDQLELPHSAFVQQAFEDPYLSGPSDLEEFGLDQHTPSASSVDAPSRLSSVSPADFKQSKAPHAPGYDLDETSFDESKFIDFDQVESPDHLFLSDMLSGADSRVDPDLSNTGAYINTESGYQYNEDHTEAQMLGNATTEPSGEPRHVDAIGQRRQDTIQTKQMHTHQPSRIQIPHLGSTHGHTKSVPSLSPVVKVSQVHRGDSPIRDDVGWSGRSNKRSSVHLSPTGGSVADSEELDSNESEHTSGAHRSFSHARTVDGSWIRDKATGQAGIDPHARNDEQGPSPKDVEEERQRADKDVDIRIWSATVSAANSEYGDGPSPWEQPRGRPRAVSAVETRQDYFAMMRPDDSRILGPGRLIDEPEPGSDFDTSSDISHADTNNGLPPLEMTVQDEPLALQLNRSQPWKDTPQYPFPLAIKTQPESSRSAMQLYEQMAKEMETASRVGTWGSKKLNDAEVDSLLKSDSFFKNLSLNKTSILKFLPKRSNSNSKEKKQHTHSFERESSITSKLSRRPSLNPKSPTGIMAAAIAGQMAGSIGSHNSLSVRSPVSPKGGSLSPSPWMANRSRSKSEGSGGPQLGLKPLTIPKVEQRQVPAQKSSPLIESTASIGVDGEDDEDDDSLDEKGIFMNLAASQQIIVPTFEGFQRQISMLDPRLEPALVHRFANEQLRRYKKLINDQARHTTLVQAGKCDAKERCFASGGRAKLLPPRANAKDSNATYCQFQIPGRENGEDDDGYDDGNKQSFESSVVPASFADGIRMPPVKRLPAEFECSLCFKVKKFQKPSDWTKHIYEDIYPFTCTIPECTSEPKSFKRKADWVRHETERHRHLESWQCNMPNCDHICHRKNNFVQHLVREHRKPDPTAKKNKASAAGGSSGGARNEMEIALLWEQVEECHHVTKARPEDEPCRFCGNICKDWRKLMAHLARHMERIALPVLRLAEEHPSSANKAVDVNQSTSGPTPSISVYDPPDTNLGLNDDTAMEEATMTDNSSVQVQPMVAYDVQQGFHVLTPAMGMGINPSGTTYPPASTSYLQPPHYTPVHQNSMSYPPAPILNIRQPTSTSAMSSGFGPTSINDFQLNVSTIGIDGPQQPLYSSPQDVCFSHDDEFIPSTSYENSASSSIADYTMSGSSETHETNLMSHPSMHASYLTTTGQMQDNNIYHHSATYPFR